MTIDEHQTVQFEEAYYLAQYPDVANAVKGGNFRSGLDHYLIVGRAEGRIPGRISGSPHQANTAAMQTLEIRPTTADGRSLAGC